MKATFNVLDRGWIPVVDLEGAHRLLGIRETLAQAHLLREISVASPLEEYSLYRFLGVFLMDVLRPKRKSSIEKLLDAGAFDMAQIDAYIGQCRAEGVSFDLFDEERPFLQSKFKTVPSSAEKPASKLDCMLPGESGHVHFVHDPSDNNCFSPDKALRLLLNSYVFCAAEGRGYYYSVYGLPPLFAVIKGKTLFETLIFSLLPLDEIQIPLDDPPVLWRNKTEIISGKSVGKVSWFEGMLFPARKIQLLPDENGTVSKVYLSGGEKYENTDNWDDPYVFYFLKKNRKEALLPNEKNAIWYNLCDIADLCNGSSLLLRNYIEIFQRDVFLTFYGLRAERGKAVFYSVHRFDLEVPIIFTKEEVVCFLRNCATQAQRILNLLDLSFKNRKKKNRSNSYWAPKYIRDIATSKLEQECENRFQLTCKRLSADDSFGDLQKAFCADIADCAVKSYNESLHNVRMNGKMLAIAAERHDFLKKQLNHIISETDYGGEV